MTPGIVTEKDTRVTDMADMLNSSKAAEKTINPDQVQLLTGQFRCTLLAALMAVNRHRAINVSVAAGMAMHPAVGAKTTLVGKTVEPAQLACTLLQTCLNP